jgi:uncharacterized membrane protein
MVLPGHLSGGYLATTALLSLAPWSTSTNELTALYIIGTIAGEIPDIDLFSFYFEKKKNKNSSHSNHREYLTHIPLFWITISLLISLFGLIISSSFIIALGFVFLVGTLSHFILDSIDFGITWLAPMSSRRFYLFPMKLIKEDPKHVATGGILYYWNYLKGAYLKQVTFYAEILITIVALFVFLN